MKTLYISNLGAAYLTESYSIRERKKGAHVCNIVLSGSDHQVGSVCLSEVFLDKLDKYCQTEISFLGQRFAYYQPQHFQAPRRRCGLYRDPKMPLTEASPTQCSHFHAAKSGCIYMLLTTKKQYDVPTSTRKPCMFQTRRRTKRCNPSQNAQRQIGKIPRVSKIILAMSQQTQLLKFSVKNSSHYTDYEG